jgi:hypothetical protein
LFLANQKEPEMTAILADVEIVETEAPKTKLAVSDLHVVRERVAKANRRLEKAGVSERFELVVGEPELVEERDPYTQLVVARYHEVEVSLAVPQIGYNGWTFVATLSFEKAGTIVRTVPGARCSYRPADQECDHCGTVRHRTETFVVFNAETGEYKQLGRNCLELFLGIRPCLWVFDVEPSLSDTDRSPRGVDLESVENIVAAALGVTKGGPGYVSQAAAEFKGVSSTQETRSCLYERPVGRYATERQHELNAYREAAAGYLADGTVAKVIEAAKAIEGDSEYADNIRILAASEYVDVKNLGLVASFVAVYNRANRVAAERKAKSDRVSGWLGDVKGQLTTTGTVVNKRFIESRYGTSTLVEWVTAEGLTCKWFSSNTVEANEGDVVTVTGTVKKHDTYQGLKSTVLTRCKLEVQK